MNPPKRLRPRPIAGADDLRQARDIARTIAEATIGRDPGPMVTAESSSHYVFVGSDIVVKIIDVNRHTRLNRETALVRDLPSGLTATLLASGLHRSGTSDIRYACYACVPGATPGMGMPGVDGATARLLAQEAVQRLDRFHKWKPTSRAEQTLNETLDHGGFVGQGALLADIETIATLDRNALVPRHLLDGLTTIARHAPQQARAIVPVHADCHWGNWLVRDQSVTALLDFEWARFGEPADDWFFLAKFSGPHKETVLDVIASTTKTLPESLRSECEVREATFIAADLREAVELTDPPVWMGRRLDHLEELVVGRHWWRPAR